MFSSSTLSIDTFTAEHKLNAVLWFDTFRWRLGKSCTWFVHFPTKYSFFGWFSISILPFLFSVMFVVRLSPVIHRIICIKWSIRTCERKHKNEYATLAAVNSVPIHIYWDIFAHILASVHFRARFVVNGSPKGIKRKNCSFRFSNRLTITLCIPGITWWRISTHIKEFIDHNRRITNVPFAQKHFRDAIG